MKKLYILIALTSLFFVQSCDKFLDLKPENIQKMLEEQSENQQHGRRLSRHIGKLHEIIKNRER